MITLMLKVGKLRLSLEKLNDFLKVTKFGSSKVSIAQIYLALKPAAFQCVTKLYHNEGQLENKHYRDNFSLGITTRYLCTKHGFIILHTAFRSTRKKIHNLQNTHFLT